MTDEGANGPTTDRPGDGTTPPLAPDPIPSIELLESSHSFPGVYQIKAIGSIDDDFEGRVLSAVLSELGVASDLEHTVRKTPGGRHVSLTLDVPVQNAEQVRTIYAKIHGLQGLLLLL